MEAKAAFGLYKCRNCQKTHYEELGAVPDIKLTVSDVRNPSHETIYHYHLCEDGKIGGKLFRPITAFDMSEKYRRKYRKRLKG